MSHSWTESLPEDWRVIPLRHVAEVQNSNVDKKTYDDGIPVRLCNYTDVYYNEYVTNDMDLMEATATPSEVHKFGLRAGDVIITKDSESWDDIAIPACVPKDLPGVVCGYHLTMLRPRRDVMEGRFLLRALQAVGIREQFWTSANGVTRFGLTQDGIKSALLPVPPVEAQRAIADFLDRKTQAIDEVIAQKEELLGLLAEQRASRVQELVTIGQRRDADLVPSGVEWFASIPRHWRVMRLKFLLSSIEQGWSPQCEQRLATGDEWGVLKVGCVNYGRWNADEHKALPTDMAPRIQHKVAVGDLLMSRANTSELVGSVALVDDLPVQLMLCDKLYRLGVLPEHDRTFLKFALNARSVRSQHEVESSGASASMQNISQERAGNIVLAVPPPDEQREIGLCLAAEEEAHRAHLDLIRDQISNLREYRQALITSAVTGKLDIPDLEAADGA